MQLFWDERTHTYENLSMHWIMSTTPSTQTVRDNLFYQQGFRNNQSFPAFFNHRLDVQNNDPGSGIIGTGLGDGDDWGTWGGWHDWDRETIEDQEARWAVTAWLTDVAAYANDNCPHTSLLADLAIRRPQNLRPAVGTPLKWTVKEVSTNTLLQEGSVTIGMNGLIVIPAIEVFPASTRLVRIEVQNPGVVAVLHLSVADEVVVYPNPADLFLQVDLGKTKLSVAKLVLFDIAGRPIKEVAVQQATSLNIDVSNLSAGLYLWMLEDQRGLVAKGRVVIE